MKNLQLSLLDFLVLPDGADESAHWGDVVGQRDTAKGLHENENQCFNVVGGTQIAETDGKHDVGAPVVTPDVLDRPRRILDAHLVVPVLVKVNARHVVEADGEEVTDSEVNEQYFEQTQVVLSRRAAEHHVLEFVELADAAHKLHKGGAEDDELQVGAHSDYDVDGEDQNGHQVNHEVTP